MTSEYKPQESQQELFPAYSNERKTPKRFPPIAEPPKPMLISTTVEQMFLAVIAVILVACFVFFLGFLRGKSVRERVPETLITRAVAAPEREYPQGVVRSGPVQAAVPASPSSFAARKPYTIQVMTNKNRQIAESLVKELQRRGYFAAIMKSGEYYQVCAGQYTTKEDAKKDLAMFAARYKGAYLRRN